MGADHGELDGAGRGDGGRRTMGRNRPAGDADGEACGGMELCAERGKERVAPGRGDERDARRAAVAPEGAGHRDGAEVEEVDEVRVGAEAGVGADRVGGDLGEGADVRDRGDDENVDAAPEGLGRAAELGEAVLAGERIGGGVAACTLDDAAGDRVERLGLRLDELADRLVALGDPGALVEERGDGEEGAEVNDTVRRAEVRHHGEGGIEGGLGVATAEDTARRVGNSDPHDRRERRAAEGEGAREGVGGIVTGGGGEGRAGGRGSAGEDREAVEAPAGGGGARGRKRAPRPAQALAPGMRSIWPG